MKEILDQYPILKNRYFIALIAFLLWMIFFDQNNIFNQYKQHRELKSMKEKEAFLDSETAKNNAEVDRLQDKFEMEKYAREQYWMKRDGEDLFIILEDSLSADSVQ